MIYKGRLYEEGFFFFFPSWKFMTAWLKRKSKGRKKKYYTTEHFMSSRTNEAWFPMGLGPWLDSLVTNTALAV